MSRPQKDNLSSIQQETLLLLSNGKTYKEIAERAATTENTVRARMYLARKFLGAKNNVHAFVKLLANTDL